MTERYIELHSSSAFSFLEGASQPEELIKRAVELEMPAMALLDRNGVYGSARFHTSAKRNDVHAHVGAEIAVSSFGNRLTPPAWLPHLHPAEPTRLPLLCESRVPTRRIGGKILIPASAVRRFAREDHPDFVRSPIFSTPMHTKKKPPVSDPSGNRSERLGETMDGVQRAGTNGRY
jgi:hypothetical protein